MLIKRLHHIASRADNAQIYCNTIFLDGQFLSGRSELSAEASSLLGWHYTQQAKIAAVTAFFGVNATDEPGIFFVNEKFSGTQILIHAFEVDSVALNRNVFNYEGFVDEILERFGVGDFCDTNWFSPP